MELFGLKLNAGELLVLGVGAQWLLAAVAHSLPEPDDKSGKAYRFISNFVQFIAANFYLMKAGTPPGAPPDPPKVVPIDRAA